MCNNPDAECYVAYVQGAMAGVIVGWLDKSGAEPSYEIRHLFVEPGFRGGEVAQALLRKLLDWAEYAPGERPVFITTEGEPRPYYRALGFEPTHRICVSSLAKLRERLRG